MKEKTNLGISVLVVMFFVILSVSVSVSYCDRWLMTDQKSESDFFSNSYYYGMIVDTSFQQGNAGTIYLRIPSNSCSICIDIELEFLINLDNDAIKQVNIITSYRNHRDLQIFKKQINDGFMVINSQYLFKEIDKYRRPYYFVLDDFNKICAIHFIIKNQTNLSLDFLMAKGCFN